MKQIKFKFVCEGVLLINKKLPIGSSQAGPCILGKLDHYWKIATPNGPSSIGCCSKCKKKALFFNSGPKLIKDEKQTSDPAVIEFPKRAAA